MSILFLTNQGSSIKKYSERIIVEKDEEELLEIPVRKTDAIIIFGNVQVSTQVFSLLGRHGVSIAYLYMNGKVKGYFLPAASKNADLRFTQYEAAQNELLSLALVKRFVENKLDGMITFYEKNKLRKNFFNLRDIREEIERAKAELIKAESHQCVLGIEGAISRSHFSKYGKLFQSELKFNGRSKRPPRDEANSLLSLTYVMLFNMITGILNGAGFDTYVGFLHKMDYNRPSLALDFLELFRAQVADRFVLNLCNKEIFKKNDFTCDPEKGFLLKEESFKKYLSRWGEFIGEEKEGIVKKMEILTNGFAKALRNANPQLFEACT